MDFKLIWIDYSLWDSWGVEIIYIYIHPVVIFFLEFKRNWIDDSLWDYWPVEKNCVSFGEILLYCRDISPTAKSKFGEQPGRSWHSMVSR